MKANKIISAVEGVTARWAKQRKREERARSAEANRYHAMTRRSDTITIREAAFEFMEEAYLKASAQGTLPALARQIMYAARPLIQDYSTRDLSSDFDKYFTQTLLPDYMAEHPSSTMNWDVVFDARGNFTEPHTDENVPLGTLNVRNYLARVADHRVDAPDFETREKLFPTLGPDHRYGAILFVEKEGFTPLFRAVHLAERYDLAIMSTKGMSVTAARLLVEHICRLDVPLLVLHDFDKSGFSIVGTLRRSTRRYQFRHGHAAQVIDLGFRLADVDGLETEDVYLPNRVKAVDNLRLNGATTEEIQFLLNERVEINAFASDELVDWLEGKLAEHGVKKVVPDERTLADAYRRMRQQALVQGKINEFLEGLGPVEEIKAPTRLAGRIRKLIKADPLLSWDEALRQICEGES